VINDDDDDDNDSVGFKDLNIITINKHNLSQFYFQ